MEGQIPPSGRPVPGLRRCSHPNGGGRVSGLLPIDNTAAHPRFLYLEKSKNSDVRKQTLISFARRNLLLPTTCFSIDFTTKEPSSIRETASLILKTRGLTQEQISLGGLIFSPKPQQRIPSIPLPQGP